MSESTLYIGGVQRFCLHDGPGIRTTVFLQGCPLRCWWCQNQSLREEPNAGQAVPVADLVDKLARDSRYWRGSGGGVTLSGGEPLSQARAASELLRLLGKYGHHRCVDTSLVRPESVIDPLLGDVDLWLIDLKHADAARLARHTGLDMGEYLLNLKRVLASGAEVEFRVPLIHGFNDSPEDARLIGKFLSDLDCRARVRLLPGHDIARYDGASATVSTNVCREICRIIRRAVPDVEVLW